MDKRTGSKLKEGKDYSVRYSLELYRYVPVTQSIAANGFAYAFITGMGCYEGSIRDPEKYRVVDAGNDISGLKAVIAPKDYTGSAITISPSDITWMQGNREVYVAPTDIAIESYKNNLKPGTDTVIVRGKDYRFGTKKIRFKIKKREFRWWWEE
ncbi:MAG: hypothetical protein K6F53_11985 [Lachnospiraceae bacterium]|nr:hypothetical protein [Lachnospiraceae bacterium]